MTQRFQPVIDDMLRLADSLNEMLAAREGVEPYRLRLARAHALALADELQLLDLDDMRAVHAARDAAPS